jgi:hypothetical protein
VNRLKDLGLNKGLENLDALRQELVAVRRTVAMEGLLSGGEGGIRTQAIH